MAIAHAPIFTNVSIKHEFLDAHRKIGLSDALCDFYYEYKSLIPDQVEKQLKSHETKHNKKLNSNESTKMELEQIREMSKLLRPVMIEEKNAWQITCEQFLMPYLSNVWKRTIKEFRIQDLRTRGTDKSKFLTSIPDWEDVR